jgi:hypothetical protein
LDNKGLLPDEAVSGNTNWKGCFYELVKYGGIKKQK